MPRCGHCGRVNPDQAVFCQDCGSRVGEEPGFSPKVEAPGRSGATERPQGAGAVSVTFDPKAAHPSHEVRCLTCGAPNPADMAFCRECGARIEARAKAPGQSSSAEQPCPRCHEPNPAEFNFCQHCGVRILDLPPMISPPTPPSGLPVSTATPVAIAGRSPRSLTPERLGAGSALESPRLASPGVPPPELRPMQTAPGHRANTGQATPAPWPGQAAGTIGGDRSHPTPIAGTSPASAPAAVGLPGALPSARAVARLVSVNRDGSDGVVFPVTGERFDIGRHTGTLLFEDDGYLSERHARLERRDGRVVLMDLDSLNGVFFRIRLKEELYPGARILVGMELLRFDLVPEHERDPAPAMEHGVLVFGTPPKLPWARLRQLTTAGIARDTYHLYRAEVVIGRESGDILFSDDDFMSRMHAAVRNEGGKAWLVDLNSSNGTYLQVRGERILAAGDYLRLGDQLLRFEEP